jgi:hypothetical protein
MAAYIHNTTSKSIILSEFDIIGEKIPPNITYMIPSEEGILTTHDSISPQVELTLRQHDGNHVFKIKCERELYETYKGNGLGDLIFRIDEIEKYKNTWVITRMCCR